MTEALSQIRQPSTTRWLIIIAVMSATLMQVLDTTIVNVALPHMQGSLSATQSEMSWALTGYLVASAIFMPLTGYLSDRLGRKKYLMICIAGFTLASALCGASTSLVEIIIFRLLQGMFGSALVPLSQAIMTEVYSREERGKAMAIWGAGVMVGPILGPTLGGYLTEIANWRWTFYINVPVGLIAFLLVWYVIPETEKKVRAMDWASLAYLFVAIGSMQYVLDKGSQQDWFDATDICIATFFSLMGLALFLWHNLKIKTRPLFDLSIFRDRNFTLSCSLLTILGLGMFGMMVLQPIILQQLMGYPVLTTGLMMAPRGISSMVAMIVVGKLISHVDARWLIAFGIAISSLGILLVTNYSLSLSMSWLIGPLLLQGFGLGLIFVPLSTLAFSNLSDATRMEAAGLYSLIRVLGSSIGISIAMTYFSRHIQIAWNHLVGVLNPYNPAYQEYLRLLDMKGLGTESISLLGQELARQAQMLAFLNVCHFIMWSTLLMLPVVLFLKKPLTFESDSNKATASE